MIDELREVGRLLDESRERAVMIEAWLRSLPESELAAVWEVSVRLAARDGPYREAGAILARAIDGMDRDDDAVTLENPQMREARTALAGLLREP